MKSYGGDLRSTRPAPVFDRIRFKLMDLFADKVFYIQIWRHKRLKNQN